MGETEQENQEFITSSLKKHKNLIMTFRGHSFSLLNSFPTNIFNNREGNILFIPGSCGSAGSSAHYIMANPKTDLSFVSNTSTGRGQVTNKLVEIFLGINKKTEFAKVMQDSSKTIEAQGGDAKTLTFSSNGEMLLKYVLVEKSD